MGLRDGGRRLYGRLTSVARSFVLVSVPDHPENGGLTGERTEDESSDDETGTKRGRI